MKEFREWVLSWLEGSVLSYLKGDISTNLLIGRIDKAINDYNMDRGEIRELIEKIVKDPSYLPHMSVEEKSRKIEIVIKSTALSNNVIVTRIGRYYGIKGGVGIRIPPHILSNVGLKIEDEVDITVDSSGRIVLGKNLGAHAFRRKIRKGGVIRLPNELSKRLGLLNKETTARVWSEKDRIIVEIR